MHQSETIKVSSVVAGDLFPDHTHLLPVSIFIANYDDLEAEIGQMTTIIYGV